MNNLSWAIYLSEVIDSLNSTLDIFVFLSLTFMFLYPIVCLILWDTAEYRMDKETRNNILHKRLKRLWFGLILIPVFVVQTLLPSKETFQMIVASEFAETGLDKIVELSHDEKSIVFKGLKKIESMLEVEEKDEP